MSEPASFAPRPIQLPAVLQFAGQPPCFGTIASISERGLAFDFLRSEPGVPGVGSAARLDFDFAGVHHASPCLLIHQQGNRALLSIREAPPAAIAALHSIGRQNAPPLAARLSILQTQQVCHTRFMEGMRAVVDDFYRQLEAASQPPRDALLRVLAPLRAQFTRQFTQAYPMYPEARSDLAQAAAGSAGYSVDMDRVDNWIRRSGIAHAVTDALKPLPETFSRHYSALQKMDERAVQHPYHAEAVLDVLDDFVAPLGLDSDARVLCYEWMAQAFQNHGATLYEAMLHQLGEVLPENIPAAEATVDLAGWLRASTNRPAGSEDGAADPTTAAQLGQLTSLVTRLTENLNELIMRPSAGSVALAGAPVATSALVPGLLARDRIMSRFLPREAAAALPQPGSSAPPFPYAHGWIPAGLGGLDPATLEDLFARLREPPPIDPGPERLAASSQVRALMLQAQGLLLEYTLNGLNYQAQPEHPVWALINALDTLHLGADDNGQFLDPTFHQAASLAMQWLLSQEDTDAALLQVNALLDQIGDQFRADRQVRRTEHLQALGEPVFDPNPVANGWCVVREEEDAIPYEILGRFGDRWALLNRSATRLLEIPHDHIEDELNAGHIELTSSFDAPFLARTASASLTASLDAIHSVTSQDTSTGCLKRSALIDEISRILAHPSTEPPPYCALIEIPALRLAQTALNEDQLAVLRQHTGEIMHGMLEPGEQCGRLNDISFLAIFKPQLPERLGARLDHLKTALENVHPEWRMTGVVIPIIDEAGSAEPSQILRRANLACASARQSSIFDTSALATVPFPSNQIEPLPLDALFLRAQQIAACADGAASHYEILLGVDEHLVPAHSTQSFVVMAEQTGRVHELDAWVLRTVLEWMEAHPEHVARVSGVSVNLSGNSLVDPRHIDGMVELLAGYPHLADHLILEVTETAAIGNLDVAVNALRRLRHLGCRVALDDFGSGYSSYGYLRRLPLDYLKIDGIYIRNLLDDPTDQALTASMVDVAHALGLKVIAEFVDNEATYKWLKDIGVDYVQGYWVHTPQPLDTLFELSLA